MRSDHRPVLFMLASTFSLSLNGLTAKYLSAEFSLYWLSFLRFLLPSLMVFAFISIHKCRLPKGKVWYSLICRALSIAACQLCFLLSLESLSLVESVVLFGTGPLFIPLLERLLFSVKVTLVTQLALLLTFSGVLMLAGDITSIALRPELLYGLGAGLCNAGSQLSLYRGSKSDLTPLELNGWGFLLAALFILPLLIAHGLTEQDVQALVQPGEYSYRWMLMGVFSLLIINTQFFRARAYRLATSNSQLAPLIFTNLMFTVVWQNLLFDEVFSGEKLAGMGLIIVACLLQMFTRQLRATCVTGSNNTEEESAATGHHRERLS